MISARFTDQSFVEFVKALGRALRATGVNSFCVDADPGDDFGELTTYGLDRMRVMVALCTKDYGQKTKSPHCAYAEVKYASDRRVLIVPIRLCSWEVWEAGMGGKDFDSARNSGAAQNKRFICAPAIMALDRSDAHAAGTLDANECAAAIKGILTRNGTFAKYPKLLVGGR